MKLKTIYFILLGVWLVDYLTTIIGVGFMGLTELNIIHFYFFSLGKIGWILCLIFGIVGLFISACLFKALEKITFKLTKKKGISNFILYIGVGTFFILEIFIIINNLKLIW